MPEAEMQNCTQLQPNPHGAICMRNCNSKQASPKFEMLEIQKVAEVVIVNQECTARLLIKGITAGVHLLALPDDCDRFPAASEANELRWCRLHSLVWNQWRRFFVDLKKLRCRLPGGRLRCRSYADCRLPVLVNIAVGC